MEFPTEIKETLTTRVKSFIKIFNQNTFPVDIQMYGFGGIHMEDSKECLARIIELSELIDFKGKLTMDKETNKAEITY